MSIGVPAGPPHPSVHWISTLSVIVNEILGYFRIYIPYIFIYAYIHVLLVADKALKFLNKLLKIYGN